MDEDDNGKGAETKHGRGWTRARAFGATLWGPWSVLLRLILHPAVLVLFGVTIRLGVELGRQTDSRRWRSTRCCSESSRACGVVSLETS